MPDELRRPRPLCSRRMPLRRRLERAVLCDLGPACTSSSSSGAAAVASQPRRATLPKGLLGPRQRVFERHVRVRAGIRGSRLSGASAVAVQSQPTGGAAPPDAAPVGRRHPRASASPRRPPCRSSHSPRQYIHTRQVRFGSHRTCTPDVPDQHRTFGFAVSAFAPSPDPDGLRPRAPTAVGFYRIPLVGPLTPYTLSMLGGDHREITSNRSYTRV